MTLESDYLSPSLRKQLNLSWLQVQGTRLIPGLGSQQGLCPWCQYLHHLPDRSQNCKGAQYKGACSYAVMRFNIHAFNSLFLTSCTRRALSSLKSQACSHVRTHFSAEGGDRSSHFYRRCYWLLTTLSAHLTISGRIVPLDLLAAVVGGCQSWEIEPPHQAQHR